MHVCEGGTGPEHVMHPFIASSAEEIYEANPTHFPSQFAVTMLAKNYFSLCVSIEEESETLKER